MLNYNLTFILNNNIIHLNLSVILGWRKKRKLSNHTYAS